MDQRHDSVKRTCFPSSRRPSRLMALSCNHLTWFNWRDIKSERDRHYVYGGIDRATKPADFERLNDCFRFSHGLTVSRLVILLISWIIYGGCTWIRDDPDLCRIAAPSRVNAFINGGYQHSEVQGDGGQL